MKKRFLHLSSILILLLVLLTGCGSMEDKLTGEWCWEGDSDPEFYFYDDGTCEIAGKYGTGTWAIVNDNQLKITDFYGQTETIDIKDVSNDKIVLGYGEHEATLVRNK